MNVKIISILLHSYFLWYRLPWNICWSYKNIQNIGKCILWFMRLFMHHFHALFSSFKYYALIYDNSHQIHFFTSATNIWKYFHGNTFFHESLFGSWVSFIRYFDQNLLFSWYFKILLLLFSYWPNFGTHLVLFDSRDE